MFKRLFPGLALFALLWALPGLARAGEPEKGAVKPTVVLRIEAFDELLANARYVFGLAGQAEFGKQLEKMLQNRVGPKGLEGLDTKKPIGLYGSVKANVERSEVVLLLPIADEKAFLTVLDNLDVKTKKSADGVYTAEVENVRFPVLFRFANGYLYGTLKTHDKSASLLDKEKLPLPATVLAGGAGELLSLTVNLDQVPNGLKEIASGSLDIALETAKDQEPPGETKAGKAVREAGIDEVGRQLKAVLKEGSAVSVRLNIKRKTNELSVEVDLAAKAGSGLAKEIAALGAFKSVAASLVAPTSAANAGLAFRLPEAVRKQLGPVVDELYQKALDAERDENKRELGKIILSALKPTAKAGTIDLGIDLRGPAKSGKYTVVVGARVAEGEGIESAIKKVLDKLPAAAKEPIALDVARVGGVNIHRITPEKGKIDENTRKLLGDGPVYFAVRKDALLVSMGDDALGALKGAVAAPLKVGHPLQLEVSLARVADLLAAKEKSILAAAKKAFKGKDNDKLRLTVEAGDSLRVKFSAKGQIVTFAAQIIKARKGEGD